MNVKEQAKIDLADACDAIEHLAEIVPDMTLKQKVDIAARLRGPAKVIETLDKAIKGEIKEECGHEKGTVKGNIFKAVLTYVTTTRLNQGKLKDERPRIYDAYCEPAEEGRVNFEPR